MPSKTSRPSAAEAASRPTRKRHAALAPSASPVTPTGIACACDFSSETPRPRQSGYVTTSALGSHLPDEAFCASTNHEAQLIGREQKFLLYVLAKPTAEHPNVIPFPRDQIHPRFRSHPASDPDLTDDLGQPARKKQATQSVRTWQVIDGGVR